MINLGRDSFNKHIHCGFCIQREEKTSGGRELYRCLWIVGVPRSPGFVSCWFMLLFSSSWLPLVSVSWWGCSARLSAILPEAFWWDQESLYNSQWTVEIRGYCVNKTLHLFAFHYVRTMYKSVILYHNIKLGMFGLWLGIKLILKSFWRIRSSEHVQQRLSRPWDQGNNFLDYQICKRPWWHPVTILKIQIKGRFSNNRSHS